VRVAAWSVAGFTVLAAAVGACSSSGSSTSASSSASPTAAATPVSGIETLTGTLTGAVAVKWLNSYGNAAPSFASLVLTGPVDTVISGPVSVGTGSATTATPTFVTPAGNFTVQYTVKTDSGVLPTVTGKSGSTCYFRLDGGTGTYTVLGSNSTGKFSGATGHGTYAITILAAANLLSDNTVCDWLPGYELAKGTSVTFKASGPLTLRQ
jgi:hypothetical protein